MGTLEKLHPVQQAWVDMDVPQCGFCQSGMLIAATSLLRKFPRPTDENINEYMDNICACAPALTRMPLIQNTSW